jgi:riboflavin kinase/FMN adenylyltransferase
MEILREPAPGLVAAPGAVVTIGAYDGVHEGHRAVIAHVRELAAERGLRTAVVTFDRHPASVVRPESAPKLLCDLDQRLELLAATGIDYTLVISFDEVRAKEPAEDFVTEVLVGALSARVVVVGDDFHFGHQRRGNVALLRAMGDTLGFDVLGIELVGIDGRPAAEPARVSSTAIRAALAAGDLDEASAMLGRPHEVRGVALEVRGVVVQGDGRARDLGFRTANLAVPDDICLPADGIYAGWYLRPSGEIHPAALSLGRRPTFYEAADTSLLEAHLLGFDGELYGEAARVRFVARLRDELKFEQVDALVEQMGRDCDEAAARLAALVPGTLELR